MLDSVRRLLDAVVGVPLFAAFAAFLAWVLMIGTPFAALPVALGVGVGPIVWWVALAGAGVGLFVALKPEPKAKAKPATPTPKAAPATPAGGDGVPLTRRQEQHRWYGDHSDLTWRDREQAQAWGMDADTYKSNFLESD